MTPVELIKLGSTMGNINAYNPNAAQSAGWEIVEDLSKKDIATGFQATTYYNASTKQYFFAVAGTNDFKDVSSWPSAILGYSGNKAQIDLALNLMNRVNEAARSEPGATVIAAGHSLSGQFTDIGTYTFGWQSVKFDAVGASNVINSSGFIAQLAEMGIAPVGGGDVISCNINGLGPFGGGVIGNFAGKDIPGTINCRIELPSSTASGIVNGILTFAKGPIGWVVSRVVFGAFQHDAKNIDQAVQSGNFTVNGVKPVPTANYQPYSYTDEDGNILRTLQGGDGRPLLDADGKPKLELFMAPATTGIGGTTLEFDSTGRVLSTTNDATPTTQNGTESNLYSLTTNNSPTTGITPPQDPTSDGPSGAGNSLLASADFNASVNYSLLGDVNTAGANTAVFNYGLTDGLRPGANNLGLNINASSGQGLNVPTNSTNLADYSLFGSSLNNAAATNFNLVPTDPLVLDLNGDGVRLTNYTDAPVLFDADNNGGSLEQTGWVSSADGIVVHDLNGDGKINNISETLSEYYKGVAGSDGNAGTKTYANGFAALKSQDSNADNQFTSTDAAWNSLRVWVDANHDGKTDADKEWRMAV